MRQHVMGWILARGDALRAVWFAAVYLAACSGLYGVPIAVGMNDGHHMSIGLQNIYIQEQDLIYAPNIVFIESDKDIKNNFSTAGKATVPGIRVDFNTTDWMFNLFTSRVMVDDEEFKERAKDSYSIAGSVARKIGDVQYLSVHMDYVKLDYLMKYKPEHFGNMPTEAAPVGTGTSYVLSVLYKYKGIFYVGYRGMFSRLDYIDMASERGETEVQMHMAVGGYETDFRRDCSPFPRWLYLAAELGIGGGDNEFLGVQSGGSIMFGGGLQHKIKIHGGYLGVRGGYKRQLIAIGREGYGATLEYGGPFLYVEMGF